MIPKRILIAEDQMSSREALTKLASLRGYDVVAVNDGFDLIAAANNEKFDVIVTDLIMPDLNGVSALEIMKLQGNTTPVIALTGISPEDVDLVHAGFAKLYQKPVNIDEMFLFIEALLAKGDGAAPPS
jgi:DNA-binding response OmpR family regulator